MNISVVIITLNEERRLPDALASVRPVADEIVVVDSLSQDKTVEVARAFGAAVYSQKFESYSAQKNLANRKANGDWILSLDADERLSPELQAAILALKSGPEPTLGGYAFNRLPHYLGRWIRHSGWYPDCKVRLFRKAGALWHGDIHEKLVLDGPSGRLRGDLYHFTYHHIGEHIETLNRYSTMLARGLRGSRPRLLAGALLLPPVTFLRHYLFKLGCLDGLAGLVIATVSAWGTALKYFKALELRAGEKRAP
jgi:glycosyltransferase involved in cell wall biosynthesis